MRTPSTNGVSVAIHELAGSAGHPLVLIAHATGFHGMVWAPLATRLADRFRLYALDFRGHGDSLPPRSGDFSWTGFADDVAAVVDGLGLDRPFGLGHSKGGAALLLAEQHRPGTLRSMYLFEPIVFPTDTRAAAAPKKADKPAPRPDQPICPRCRQYELLASVECPSGYC